MGEEAGMVNRDLSSTQRSRGGNRRTHAKRSQPATEFTQAGEDALHAVAKVHGLLTQRRFAGPGLESLSTRRSNRFARPGWRRCYPSDV